MDINKKFLYFNTDSANQDGAITVPVSTLVAFDVRANDAICVMIKEAVQTDTTDVFLSKPSGDDPRDIIEKIVNEINFSKDAMIVVGDDNTSEYIHSDIDGIDSISTAIYTNPTIKLGSRVESIIGFANSAGNGSVPRASNVGEFNSEIITTLFVDLADGSNTIACPGTQYGAIGIASSTEPAYLTQLTTATNGIIYKGEVICVEAPTGTGTTGQINLVANTVGTIDPGEDTTAGTADVIMDMNNSFTIAEMREFNSSTLNNANTENPQGAIAAGGIQNYYLYLSPNSSSQAGGNYSAGKLLIRLYGAKTDGL